MSEHTLPSWVPDAVFYQIVPDRFAPPTDHELSRYARDAFDAWSAPAELGGYRGGTLWGVVRELDRLVDLGVTALYLNPIQAATTYHRYKPADFFKVDPMLGGDPAFDALLEAARERGLRIVLDAVLNHVGLGFLPFADVLDYQEKSPYRDWFLIDSFPIDPLNARRTSNHRIVKDGPPPSYKCWNDNPTMPCLNHDNPAVRDFLFEVVEHWLRRGIDGWRFDAVGDMGARHDFWREVRSRMTAINPDSYLLAEHWTDPSAWLDGTQWDGVTSFPTAFSIRELVGGAHLDLAHRLPGQAPADHVDGAEMARRLEELTSRHPWPHVVRQLNFVNNHDISRFVTAVGGDRQRALLAAFLLFSLPGAPCVLYGDEVGLGGSRPPDAIRGFPGEADWHIETLEAYRELIAGRKALIALRRGGYGTLRAQDRALAFARPHREGTVVVVANPGETPVRFELNRSHVPGTFHDDVVLTHAVGEVHLTADDGRIFVTVGPLSGGWIGPAVERELPSSRAGASLEVRAPLGPVVVVGNIGIDTNVYLPEGFPGFSGDRIGGLEGAFTENLDVIGQAGGYCSFGFASLGVATRFVGYLGDDPMGRWIEAELRDAGIDPLLFIDPAGTSRSINLMRPDGGRNNCYDGKSHMTLEPDLDACRRAMQGARLVHCHLPNWGRRLLPLAREVGATISVDLQDMTSADDPYRGDFIDAADVIFFSATNVDAFDVGKALLARRPEAVLVIGMGARGAGLMTAELGFKRFDTIAEGPPIVDTNGAGDSLAVGFLTAHVLEGRRVEEAIRWGQTAARHVCTLKGGWRNLITRDVLDGLDRLEHPLEMG